LDRFCFFSGAKFITTALKNTLVSFITPEIDNMNHFHNMWLPPCTRQEYNPYISDYHHTMFCTVKLKKMRFLLHDTQKLGMRLAQKKIYNTKIDGKSPDLSISGT